MILDRFHVDDIPKTKSLHRRHRQYHWDYYSEVAFQRVQIFEELKKALLDRTEGPFPFSRWQRAVKYKYALSPLNVRGSLIATGGRFNIGRIDDRFPTFPALYIAKTKETAEDELLSRKATGELLSTEELALTRTASMAVVSVGGKLETVFDLRNEKNLAPFVELTRHFILSERLKSVAKELKLDPPRMIGDPVELKKNLLEPHWRYWPMQMDVPSNSQLFGQLAKEAGIGGIVYPSVLTGGDCLALFPENLAGSRSYLEIEDPVPKGMKCRRLDSKTFGEALSDV